MSLFSLTAVVVLAVAAGSAAAAQAVAGNCAMGQVVKTKSYVVALSIGPMETMYTQAEVRAKHPKDGEVMLSGTMTGGMAAMTMSRTNVRHLEVHICALGGAVVMHAHPTIAIQDLSSKAGTMMVPIATMEGIGEGAADYHYGNNVTLIAGHHLTVTVILAGQRAVFHTTVAHTSM